MIFLCDYYNQASKDLAYSLQVAGYDATTVVINPDGFLPQGALSPFTYCVEAEEETGKPRFFNQVPVPAFWEISGNNITNTDSALPKPLMMRTVRQSLPATKPKKATNESWKIISPVIFS